MAGRANEVHLDHKPGGRLQDGLQSSTGDRDPDEQSLSHQLPKQDGQQRIPPVQRNHHEGRLQRAVQA